MATQRHVIDDLDKTHIWRYRHTINAHVVSLMGSVDPGEGRHWDCRRRTPSRDGARTGPKENAGCKENSVGIILARQKLCGDIVQGRTRVPVLQCGLDWRKDVAIESGIHEHGHRE